MTLPAFIYGSLIAIFFSAAWHVWRGGTLRRLAAYLLIGIAAFWVGHYFSFWMNINFFMLGLIRLDFALIFCIAGLFVSEKILNATQD